MTARPLPDDVLIPTPAGLYCPSGGFYIDPMRRVDRAVITHAHSDHARRGMGQYLATPGTAAALRLRLGAGIAVQELAFGTPLRIGGAVVSLHPSGHLPGAAQVRVATPRGVWVVSGDYKTEDDGLAEPFDPVPCDTFITECTFGLPLFRWQPQASVMAEILQWWQANAAAGRLSVIAAYSLGKAQRLIAALPQGPGPIISHPTIAAATQALRAVGYALPAPQVSADPPPGALLIAPPGSARPADIPRAEAMASGWMALARHRPASGAGFVLSDHADWPGLNAAVAATGAERVLTTHGYTAAFARWLRDSGRDAAELEPAAAGGGR